MIAAEMSYIFINNDSLQHVNGQRSLTIAIMPIIIFSNGYNQRIGKKRVCVLISV